MNFDPLRADPCSDEVRPQDASRQRSEQDGPDARTLMGAADATPQLENRIIIKTRGRVIFLDADEIDWIEAASNYVELHSGKDSYRLRRGIGKVLARLDARQFVRIHRSAIVNIRSMRELRPCNSGEYIVVLKCGKELPCSRGYRSGLRKLIDDVL